MNIVGVKGLGKALRRLLRALARASWLAYDLGGGFDACVFARLACHEQNFAAATLLA